LGDGPVAESIFLTNPGCEELESSYAGDAPGKVATDKYTPDREDRSVLTALSEFWTKDIFWT